MTPTSLADRNGRRRAETSKSYGIMILTKWNVNIKPVLLTKHPVYVAATDNNKTYSNN